MTREEFAERRKAWKGNRCSRNGWGKGAERARERFAQADADEDGKINREEFEDVCELRFHEIDADEDGTVTLAELEAYCKTRRRRWN